MKKMKRLLISILIIIVLSISCVYGITSINSNNTFDKDTTIIEQVDSLTLKQIQKDSIKSELIVSVTKYINKKAPNAHDSIPAYIVKHALVYDIDLCFMMSQTEIETNFGTTGAGRATSKKSLFGVHIYPGTPFKGYKNYDVAVEDYCKLLRRSYLVKGRDEHYLMKNYVNGSGNRYAAAGRYEANLRMNYKTIKSTTDIDRLQDMYNSIIL